MEVRFGIKDVSQRSREEFLWNKEEVKKFRELILKDTCPNSRTDDVFLLSFLRAKKFNRDAALQLLRDYYDVRKRYPEIYKDLNPSTEKKCIELKLGGYLPTTNQDGCVITIARFNNWDTSITSAKSLIRNTLLYADMLLDDHLIQINGVIVIVDAKSFTWSHLLQATPRMVYLALSSLYGSYPLRCKSFHIINVNRIFQYAAALLLPVMPHKLKTRIQFHSYGLESLHKCIDPKYLPVDYGGELPAFDPSDCNHWLFEHENIFRENEKYWTVNKV